MRNNELIILFKQHRRMIWFMELMPMIVVFLISFFLIPIIIGQARPLGGNIPLYFGILCWMSTFLIMTSIGLMLKVKLEENTNELKKALRGRR